MPRSVRWRDLSKQTRSGLSLPQYRLTIPGANAELVLTGVTVPSTVPELRQMYWTIRCTACRLPETRLSVPSDKLYDVDVVQATALQALQKHLMDQQAVTVAMLDALDGIGVAQPKSKTKTAT